MSHFGRYAFGYAFVVFLSIVETLFCITIIILVILRRGACTTYDTFINTLYCIFYSLSPSGWKEALIIFSSVALVFFIWRCKRRICAIYNLPLNIINNHKNKE